MRACAGTAGRILPEKWFAAFRVYVNPSPAGPEVVYDREHLMLVSVWEPPERERDGSEMVRVVPHDISDATRAAIDRTLARGAGTPVVYMRMHADYLFELPSTAVYLKLRGPERTKESPVDLCTPPLEALRVRRPPCDVPCSSLC